MLFRSATELPKKSLLGKTKIPDTAEFAIKKLAEVVEKDVYKRQPGHRELTSMLSDRSCLVKVSSSICICLSAEISMIFLSVVGEIPNSSQQVFNFIMCSV